MALLAFSLSLQSDLADIDPSTIHVASIGGRDLKKEHNRMIEEGKIVLVLRKGEYRVEKGDLEYGKYMVLHKPTKIYGQGRGMTTLVGFGLLIKGRKSDGSLVHLQIHQQNSNLHPPFSPALNQVP